MHDEPKQSLAEMHKAYETTPLPAALEGAVLAGMARAKKRRRMKTRSRLAAWTAAAVLLLFIGSVRVSPVFASYVSRIPGMEGVVGMISRDKGLQLAIDHDLMQEVGVSASHDGITFRVDGVIADEARIVIFYTMETEGNAALPDFYENQIKLFDYAGQEIKEGYSVVSGSGPADGKKSLSRTIEVNLEEGLRLSPRKAKATFWKTDENRRNQGQPYEVTFPIDQEKFKGMRTEQEIGKTFTTGGQTFTIEHAIYYPTRMLLTVSYDPANPLHIFGLSGVSLKDESGRTWSLNSSGATGYYEPDGFTFYFESSYFTRPRRLTFEGTGVNALAKKDLTVRIDPAAGKLLEGPPGMTFAGTEIVGKDREIRVEYPLSAKQFSSLNVQSATDSEGREFVIERSGYESTMDETRQSANLILKGGADMKGIITMTIGGYSSVIGEPFSVEFKTPFE